MRKFFILLSIGVLVSGGLAFAHNYKTDRIPAKTISYSERDLPHSKWIQLAGQMCGEGTDGCSENTHCCLVGSTGYCCPEGKGCGTYSQPCSD